MSWRTYLHIFANELRRLVSYRVDFWFNFFGTVLAEFAAAYFLWSAVFAHNNVTEMNGYTLPGLMLYYILAPITVYIISGRELGVIAQEIYDGSLTRYLIYPTSFFSFKMIGHLAFSFFSWLQLLLALVVAFFVWGSDLPLSLSPTTILLFTCTAVLSSMLFFTLESIVEMCAFWADNVWSLTVMLKLTQRLLSGALVPLAFFPEWSQQVLQWLPFKFFAAIPLDILYGRMSPVQVMQQWLLLALWMAGLLGIANLVWRRGLKVYSGVGI